MSLEKLVVTDTNHLLMFSNKQADGTLFRCWFAWLLGLGLHPQTLIFR